MTEQEQDWMPYAMAIIQDFECSGIVHLKSFIVPGEEHLQATVGWGRAIPLAKHPMTITKETADLWLAQDIHVRHQLFVEHVPVAVRNKMTPGQIAAFISWAYNGKGWMASDSFHKLCAGDIAGFFAGAATWIRGEHDVMAGLVRRRAFEWHLATRGEFDKLVSAKGLNWYRGLNSVVNQANKLKKKGHLAWQGDRLIYLVA